MPRKADLLFIAALCLVSLGLWSPRLKGPIDLRFDAAVYYVTGTSLAEGKGYRLLNEPGEVPAVQYPPALPALVALHQMALGSSDPQLVGQWLRWTYLLIFTAYLLSVYALSRIYLRPVLAFVASLLTGLFLLSYYLSDLLFTEIPFALASVLLILCSRRSGKPIWFSAAAVLGAVAYLLRSAGIALLAAWVAEALVQRRWKQAAARIACSLVPIVGWQVYLHQATSSPQYTEPAYAYQRADYQYYNVPYTKNVMLRDPFRPEEGHVGPAGLTARVAWHLVIMPPRLGEVVSTKIEFWTWLFWDLERRVPGQRSAETTQVLVRVASSWGYVPLTLLGLLTVWGGTRLIRRRQWLIPLYLAATVVVVAMTPWPGQFARYLTPIAPLLSLCLVLGLVDLRRLTRGRWQGRWRHYATTLMVLVLAGALLMQAYTLVRTFRSRPGEGLDTYGQAGARLFYYDATWHAYASALEWVRQTADPDDVVAASIPHWAYIQTGLKTVMPPMEPDPDLGQQLLDSVPVRYLIIDQVVDVDVARRYSLPTIERHPESWELVLSIPHDGARGVGIAETHVYRRTVEQP